MKTSSTALLAALAAALLLTSCSRQAPQGAGHEGHELTTAADTAGREYYTCPMHPSVVSDKPGACPVCGMALVKKAAQAKASDAEMKNLQAVSLSPSQRVMANVRTEPVRRQPFEHALNAVGVIDYAEPLQAKVTAQFRGRIERLFVSFTGEVVRRGQPLFELHSPDLATAEQDFILALNAQGGAPQEDLAAASRERLIEHFGLTPQQVEAVARTRKAHATVTFYSPIQGTVISKDVQQGQYVDEGMQLYQLADLTKVWAYLDVYEKDLATFRLGQQVAIRADAYPGRDFRGRVAFIDPSVDPQSRTIRVRVELDNKEGLLKPQMYVRAAARMRMGESLVVPRSAVLSTGRRTVVWIEVQPNTFEPRDVRTGMADEANVEILSGLSEGEMVAVSGGFLLDSESSLQAPSSADPHAGHGAPPGGRQQEEPRDTAPGVENPHEGHGGGGPAGDARPVHQVRNIPVDVDVHYAPEVVKAKSGERIRLLFTRKSDENCTGELVFPTLNIRKTLPVGRTVAVELTAEKPGAIPFACGMDMVKGSLVIE